MDDRAQDGKEALNQTEKLGVAQHFSNVWQMKRALHPTLLYRQRCCMHDTMHAWVLRDHLNTPWLLIDGVWVF